MDTPATTERKTMKTYTEFSIREPLGVDWSDQLLCQHVIFKKPVDLSALALCDGQGRETPFQATRVEPGRNGKPGSADLWFWCDLPADSEARFRLTPSQTAPWKKPIVTPRPVDRPFSLTTGCFRIKLPGSRRFRKPVAADRLPGPILGFSRSGHGWIGGSRIESRLLCRSVTTTVVETGPLWTDVRVGYEFEHGSTYAMTLRLYKGRDYVVIDERMAMRLDSRVIVRLYDGFEPDRFYSHVTCPVVAQKGHGRVEKIQYGADVRLREIQVPAIGTYYVPHLAGYGGLFNSRHKDRGLVGIVGLDGELWESAMHNRMRLAVRDGRGGRDVVLEMPAKAGRRIWALVMTDVDAAVKTAANEQSGLLMLQIRQSETRLRDVLNMRLGTPRAPTPPLLFDDALVERARRRLIALPSFKQRLESVEAGSVADPAFAYLMTGRRDYAEKVKGEIAAGLRGRFLHILLRGGGVADCSLATIFLSRTIRAWTGMLDLIRREPGLLDDARGRDIERLMLFWAHKMMAEGMWPHGRTALHQDHPESQKPLYSFPGDRPPDQPYWINCLPNFQSDWLIALAWIGLSFPGHPQSRAWIDRCLKDLDNQFEYFVFDTGAWIESMNYAMYTLNYYAHFFAALKSQGYRDYFADERLLRWLNWHTRMLTPPDPRIGGLQTQAAIGNAVLPDGQAAVFNWYAQRIPDRELAGRLVDVWRREGRPDLGHPGGTAIFESLLDPDQEARPLPKHGSTIEPGFGAILRHGEGTAEETFLTFKSGAVFSHYEGDELAFHWHARGVPLCSDYGVYQAPSAGWDAHNLVEVPAIDGIRRGFLTEHYLDESADYLVGDLPALIRFFEDHPEGFRDPNAGRFSQKYNYLDHEAPLGPKVWIRRALLFVKPHYLVLLDDVDGVTPSRFNIHCVADKVNVKRDRVEFAGRFGMNLTVFVADPARFTALTGRHDPKRANVDHSQWFARIRGDHRDHHYRTVLYPHRGTEDVRFKKLGDGVGVQVNGPCGVDHVWLARHRVECRGKDYAFVGQVAFTRETEKCLEAHLIRGDHLSMNGLRIDGSGPIFVRRMESGDIRVRCDGPARRVTLRDLIPRTVQSVSPGVSTIGEGDEVRLDLPPGKNDMVLR